MSFQRMTTDKLLDKDPQHLKHTQTNLVNSVTTSSVHLQCLSVVLALKLRRVSSQLNYTPSTGTHLKLPFK